MVSSLLDVADWEEYITLEGWMGTLEVVNNHYDTFLEPLVKHFADVNVAGQALCYRSLLAVYEDLARAPDSLALEELDVDCAAPLTRAETTALLSFVLPMAPPDGMTCVDLSTVDFMNTNPFGHHAHLHASDGAAGTKRFSPSRCPSAPSASWRLVSRSRVCVGAATRGSRRSATSRRRFRAWMRSRRAPDELRALVYVARQRR